MDTDTNKLTTQNEVESFLEGLRVKLKFQNVFWDQRSVNISSYAMLNEWGYTHNDLVGIIKKLTHENYSEGPKPDDQNTPSKGPLWVFGRFIQPINKRRKKEGREFYIKLQIGYPNKEVICISFHPSIHPMYYPLMNATNE